MHARREDNREKVFMTKGRKELAGYISHTHVMKWALFFYPHRSLRSVIASKPRPDLGPAWARRERHVRWNSRGSKDNGIAGQS